MTRTRDCQNLLKSFCWWTISFVMGAGLGYWFHFHYSANHDRVKSDLEKTVILHNAASAILIQYILRIYRIVLYSLKAIYCILCIYFTYCSIYILYSVHCIIWFSLFLIPCSLWIIFHVWYSMKLTRCIVFKGLHILNCFSCTLFLFFTYHSIHLIKFI